MYLDGRRSNLKRYVPVALRDRAQPAERGPLHQHVQLECISGHRRLQRQHYRQRAVPQPQGRDRCRRRAGAGGHVLPHLRWGHIRLPDRRGEGDLLARQDTAVRREGRRPRPRLVRHGRDARGRRLAHRVDQRRHRERRGRDHEQDHRADWPRGCQGRYGCHGPSGPEGGYRRERGHRASRLFLESTYRRI